MFADVVFPSDLSPEKLDDYLEKAWFRIGQSMFTTNFLNFNGNLYSAFWLQIGLENFIPSKSQISLLKKNKHFKVEVKPLVLNEEKEELFRKYRLGINFETSNSLFALLLTADQDSIFNTYCIEVFDNEILIACGVFDLGKKSAQGIVCFYDQKYKKNSLGKFIMLQKILYLQSLGIQFFFPGYFAQNYPKFDYKLELSKETTNYFSIQENRWIPFAKFDSTNSPLSILSKKMEHLMELMIAYNLPFKYLIYDYFDLNMVRTFNGQVLLETPFFLHLFTTLKTQLGIICYDIFKGEYQLVLCGRMYDVPDALEHTGHYNVCILKVAKILISDQNPEGIIEKTLDLFRKNLEVIENDI